MICTVEDFVNDRDIANQAVAGQLEVIKKEDQLEETMETLRVVARYTLLQANQSKEVTDYVDVLLRNNNLTIKMLLNDK